MKDDIRIPKEAHSDKRGLPISLVFMLSLRQKRVVVGCFF